MKLYGIRYIYSDQYSNVDGLYPIAFTSRKKAKAYLEASASAPYLVLVELKVNP